MIAEEIGTARSSRSQPTPIFRSRDGKVPGAIPIWRRLHWAAVYTDRASSEGQFEISPRADPLSESSDNGDRIISTISSQRSSS